MSSLVLRPRPLSRWPAPALVGWLLAWLVWALAGWAGASPTGAFALAALTGAALALASQGPWRRGIVAAGFPLSAAAQGLAGAIPPWAWLLALLPLLLAYPLRAWRCRACRASWAVPSRCWTPAAAWAMA
jgi:hypothetical protein